VVTSAVISVFLELHYALRETLQEYWRTRISLLFLYSQIYPLIVLVQARGAIAGFRVLRKGK
jgi:hypothetical protein